MAIVEVEQKGSGLKAAFEEALKTKQKQDGVLPVASKPEVEVEEVLPEVEEAVEVEAKEEEAVAEEVVEAEISTEKEKEHPHRDTRAEKKIARLHAEKQKLAEEVAYYRGLANQAQAGGASNQPLPQQNNQVFDTLAPNPANYTDPIEFQLDVREYKRELQRKEKAFKEQVTLAAKKYPDLQDLQDESIASAPNPTVQGLLLDSEVAGDLYHHFLSNEDEYERINKMNPLQAAKAIGKIEARLQAKEVVKAQTKAKPAPLTPVKSSKAVQTKQSEFTEY